LSLVSGQWSVVSCQWSVVGWLAVCCVASASCLLRAVRDRRKRALTNGPRTTPWVEDNQAKFIPVIPAWIECQ
jgi:hypothetical protein